jgi:uracil-DNA glycosylase
MNWDNFKKHFHPSYERVIRPFIESRECDEIYSFLKKRSKEEGVSPSSSDVFNSFKKTNFDELKVVMIGDGPYAEGGNDGLLLGCSERGIVSKQLGQFYTAIENDLYEGINLNYTKNPDVSYLSTQGVLMLPVALTTEVNNKGSHISLWKPFIKYLLEQVFAHSNIPVIILGQEASYLLKSPLKGITMMYTDPASSDYSYLSDDVFKNVNDILLRANGEKIDWLGIGDNLPF